MRNNIITAIDQEQVRSDFPRLRIGQAVQVDVRIREGNKERIQVFEGIIIAMRGAGVTATFTVRKESYGVGVERTFLLNSPIIAAITILRNNKVRRAKLYYMRDRRGKATRLQEDFGTAIEQAKTQAVPRQKREKREDPKKPAAKKPPARPAAKAK